MHTLLYRGYGIDLLYGTASGDDSVAFGIFYM
jgi:hypothetical protein